MKRYLFSLAIIMIIMSFSVSAEITFNQPKSVYSLGDKLEINAVIEETIAKNDFFSVSLECSNDSIELYRGPLFVEPNKKKETSVEVYLDRVFVGELRGECKIGYSFGDYEKDSQLFSINPDVEVYIENINFAFIIFYVFYILFYIII